MMGRMQPKPPSPDTQDALPRGVARRIEWRGGYALTGLSAAGCLAAVALLLIGHWGWGLAVFASAVLLLLRLLLS